MSASRRKKRPRVSTNDEVYRIALPITDEDYTNVHMRDTRLLHVSSASGRVVMAPAETVHISRSEQSWHAVTSWAPLDDSSFALDPDSGWYDEALERDVMQDAQQPEPKKKKKKPKSKLARRPHVVWRELHRSTYLDEVLRFAGRADFRTAEHCTDCLSRRSATPGPPLFRCKECFMPDLVCQTCCVRRHTIHPLHRIEEWKDARFVKRSLKSLGLKVQLNHASMHCDNPIPCHSSMMVLHTNGLHEIAINYCGCVRALPQHIQLLRRRLYPASQVIVKTCATFELLDLLHKFALTTKASTYDFYRGLEKLTANAGVATPKSRYRSLFRMIMQWRHLKLLKWGGRAHDPAGVDSTSWGQLALLCPSCPHPGINLPDDWKDAPIGLRFLYMMFICMDANFRLKNQLVSNYSQDPGLGIGWAYLVPRKPYEDYVLSQTNDEDISTCVGLQALAQANTRFSAGLRYTGVGGAFCGRSEMVLPNGVGNLQKGERYSNMDYIFASVVRRYVALLLLLISYDIVCQWFKNLFARMTDTWPEVLRVPSTVTLIPAIPKLHEPMHHAVDHQVYSLNLIPGVGHSDCECPERFWSGHNALGNATKSQGPGSRHDVLDDHFSFWNWLKYVGMGKSLSRKFRAAVAERNIQNEGHRGLSDSLAPGIAQKWEAICIAWEEDSLPKKKANPYDTEGITITESKAKKELADEEADRLKKGGVSLHATSAPAFLVMGLEIEDAQRRLRRLAKGTSSQATARQEGSLAEQRNQLTARLRTWEQLLLLYIPGLLQYRANLAHTPDAATNASGHPEDIELWFPSKLPGNVREKACTPLLPDMEERLRTAQCHDALENLRHVLKIKARLIKFKNKNLRGQREGTRSRAVIDRVHERARAAAEKYRAARAALLCLVGHGPWENELRVLLDSDIKGYQDPNQLRDRKGRKGTLEDEQLASEHLPPGAPMETDDFTLYNDERSKRDGTGETRRTLSWIWLTKSGMDNPDNQSDDILRAEWSKSRARAARATEEVMLLQEEMRRTLVFLEWKSTWWLARSANRNVGKDLAEALSSYASSQSNIQLSLAQSFRNLWKQPLSDPVKPTPGSTATSAHNIRLPAERVADQPAVADAAVAGGTVADVDDVMRSILTTSEHDRNSGQESVDTAGGEGVGNGNGGEEHDDSEDEDDESEDSEEREDFADAYDDEDDF